MRVALVYLNNDTCSVSRGPGYIASVVLSAGHALKFFDTAYICLERVRAEVTSGEYDILLISASSLFYTEATTLAAAVKQTSDIPILLGGIHATIIQGEILNECPDIDYICIGEGEGFIVDFLESMASGGMVKSIDNLGYRDDDGTAQVNPIRPCTDLKTLPPFRFDLFRPESIVNGYPKPDSAMSTLPGDARTTAHTVAMAAIWLSTNALTCGLRTSTRLSPSCCF